MRSFLERVGTELEIIAEINQAVICVKENYQQLRATDFDMSCAVHRCSG